MVSTMSEKEKNVIIPDSDPDSEWFRGEFIILRLLNRFSRIDCITFFNSFRIDFPVRGAPPHLNT